MDFFTIAFGVAFGMLIHDAIWIVINSLGTPEDDTPEA
jgi:hypothetical protein